MNEKIPEILRQIETVVVGKNEIVEKILMAILAGGHVLMEDVPGVGKTTTAMTFAKVLGLDTKRVQFTSDTVPSPQTATRMSASAAARRANSSPSWAARGTNSAPARPRRHSLVRAVCHRARARPAAAAGLMT